MSQLDLELEDALPEGLEPRIKGSQPPRLDAPRYPFIPPDPDGGMDDAAGIEDPEGRTWCGECAPVSIYWRAKRRRLPKGWKRIPRRPRTPVVPACCYCGEPVR